MILCINCSHQSVCEDGLAHISNKDIVDDCHFYEKERVKCEGGCVKVRDEYVNTFDDALFETRTIKNTYCPKCGTEIKQ